MSSQDWLAILITIIALGIVVGSLLWWSNKTYGLWSKVEIKDLPDGGIKIPVTAGYGGIKGVPILALGHNNLNPLLILYPDRITYRAVWRKKEVSYQAIDLIDVDLFLGAKIIITWKDGVSRTSFGMKKEFLQETLKFLTSKNIPLSAEAKQFSTGG